jgi:tetratricopeptide (TPR) repeat protein
VSAARLQNHGGAVQSQSNPNSNPKRGPIRDQQLNLQSKKAKSVPSRKGASLPKGQVLQLETMAIPGANSELRNEIARGVPAELRAQVIESLRTAQLLSEKCDLKEARKSFELGLDKARALGDLRLIFECLSGLLRLAGEALDSSRIEAIEQELDHWMSLHRDQVPSSAWYCKGAVARHQERLATAQHCFLRALKLIRTEEEGLPGIEPGDRLWLSREEKLARTWLVLAAVQARKGQVLRSRFLAGAVYRRFGQKNFRSLNGIFYLLIGKLDENEGHLELAMESYRKAHATLLAEHNWYYSLSVLFAYARIARLQRNFAQALWHLELVEKACSGDEFRMLKREVG